MRKTFYLLVAIGLLISGCSTINKQTISVYVYYQFPPFIIDTKPDLSNAFVQRLNETTDYHWQLIHLTRAQLNNLREQGQRGAILWSHPQWFGDTADLLASEPLLWDADVLVFNLTRPLTGTFPEAIFNKKFCALRGHRYLKLEKYIADGSVKIIERERVEECVELLKTSTVDFIQMEKSNLFTTYTPLLDKEIDFLEPAIDSFPRFMLLDATYEHALAQLNRTIINLRDDREWKEQLANFGESRFVDLFDLSLEDLMQVEMP
ncbi:MAG: hypothetical protein B0W54_22995 [Cellvibrio sp. 79]|nr:MAG: hypothetical protein B0W54_22995 [Cellvibrio sp. 79]